MSSGLQSIVELFRLTNCASVILATGVIYDYSITFSREVEYIWSRSWTWISTLFLVVRYLGICHVLLASFAFSTLFPASVVVSVSTSIYDALSDCRIEAGYYSKGTVSYLVNQFLLLLFNAAVDLVMIMRIYAMWSRSKIILGLLLCIFVPETIIAFVFAATFDNPNTYMSMTTTQILDISVCSLTYNLPSPLWTYLTPTFTMSAALLILPVIRTSKVSIDMYKTTKKWQPNRYMKLFVRDGILYFFVRSLYDIQWAIAYAMENQSNLSNPFTNSLSLMLLFSMLPRFIINLRELYDRDIRCHRQGIDTGFGAFSRTIACEDVIAFADVCTQTEGQIMEVHTGDLEMLAFEVIKDGHQGRAGIEYRTPDERGQ